MSDVMNNPLHEGETVVGFDQRTADRVVKSVRSVESMNLVPRSSKAKQNFSTVLLFEVVSGPVDGVYQVKILKRSIDGVYEPVSDTEVRMEDINAV